MDPTPGDESPIKLPASVPDSQTEAEGKTEENFIRYWLQQIQDAHAREKHWRQSAMMAVELYEAAKKKDYQYNVLYSNTETFAPALYNQVPRPIVQRRFKDPDPLGKVCSEVVKRLISFLADANDGEYPDLDECLTQATLEALVPGRGVIRWKHEVEFCNPEKRDELQGSGGSSQDANGQNAAAAAPGAGGEASEGDESSEAAEGEIAYETVVPELFPWERFCHGYAKQWRLVPWICFDHYMTREELCQNFGRDLGARVKLTETEKESEEGTPGQDKWSKKRDDQKGVQLALVHEIWNKVTREVFFISAGLPKEVIRRLDDPLELTGFFPMEAPLVFFQKIKTLVPTTLYAQYEEQAKELNRLTVRINRIIGACKVRGMYDKRIGGIERLISQDDNTLLPAENCQLIGDNQVDLDRAVWIWPIEKLVQVLEVLYRQREACKQVIFDITGVADIMRGASKASETLGSQEIKEQWGSLRLSRMQKRVQRFARGNFRIMAEIAVTRLTQTTIAKMTGLQYPTMEEKQKAQMLLQQAQQQLQAMAPPGGPQQGQPPPQIPPQIQQEFQQLQEIAAKPAWEDILGVLGSDLNRSYRIDIETNSTVDPEATDDKENIAQLFNAIGQFVNSFAPLLQNGIMPMDALKGMLLVAVRRFKFGPEIEDYLEGMKAPTPQQNPTVQAEQVKAQAEVQKAQMDGQLAQQKNQHEIEKMQQDAQRRGLEHQMKMEELQAKMQIEMQKLNLEKERLIVDMQRMQAEVAAARAMPQRQSQTQPRQPQPRR